MHGLGMDLRTRVRERPSRRAALRRLLFAAPRCAFTRFANCCSCQWNSLPRSIDFPGGFNCHVTIDLRSRSNWRQLASFVASPLAEPADVYWRTDGARSGINAL